MCKVHSAISQPFTIYQPEGRMHLSGCAKASAIFLAVVAGVLTCGLLAVPVFFLSAALFRHAAVNEYHKHPYAFNPVYVAGRPPIIVPDRAYFGGGRSAREGAGRRGHPARVPGLREGHIARNPWIRG